MKLPSEARIRRWALVSFWAASGGPPLTPPRPFLCGNCAHFIKDALASVQRRVTAVRDAESSPGGSSSNALDVTTAERARAPPQPLLMVAKCSVMIGGHQVSSRRLLGRSGPKSGSAGSRWRPQHTRKSRAARAMAPVLQDKTPPFDRSRRALLAHTLVGFIPFQAVMLCAVEHFLPSRVGVTHMPVIFAHR